MKSLLLTYMNNGILVSILVLLLFFFQKILRKYLSNICLYLCCMVLLFAYLIPFRPFAENSLFTLTTPRVDKEITESAKSLDLLESNSHTTYFTKMPSNSVVINNDSPIIVPVTAKAFQIHINLIWAFGAFIVFSYHLITYYLFHKSLKRTTTPLINQSILQLLNINKKQLKINSSVTCRISSSLRSPITIGLFHPIIILPSNTYTNEELNYILRHELVHIKRKDILLQWLLLVCLSIHWYNPIIYLFIKLWNELCESSCDSIVLNNATITERIQYSRTLLQTASNQNQIHQLLFINFNGGKKRMKNRLESILDTKKKKTSILIIMVLALILCTTSVFSFAKDNTDKMKPLSKESIGHIETSTDLSTKITENTTSIETNTDENSPNFSLKDFITELKTYEGSSYIYGGNSPETGFDASGFTQYIYSLYGYTLPRTSLEQCNSLPTIDQEDIQPGDLVFYANNDNKVGHAAIYLGDDQVIHASNPKEGVKISPIDYRPVYSIGRVLQ